MTPPRLQYQIVKKKSVRASQFRAAAQMGWRAPSASDGRAAPEAWTQRPIVVPAGSKSPVLVVGTNMFSPEKWLARAAEHQKLVLKHTATPYAAVASTEERTGGGAAAGRSRAAARANAH